MSEVHPGDIIAGKFQVERVLGEGGMGYVVAARHLQLGQMVALKFMREDVMTDEYRSRFLREARNTVRLRSKHVTRVLDVGSLEGGVPYMVMEYLEGTDLSELLQQLGPFPPEDACDYIIQACEAIAEAHGYGIIHRDLKPANLFLTKGSGGEPVIKVLDFGVSKVLDLLEDTTDRHHADSVVTKATDLLGSPSYMSPEQVMSSRDADAGSDVWSLGVILFRLISAKPPFTGNSLGDLIQKIVHGPLPNLRDFRPDIPEGLEHVLFQALERDRARRPSVVELARLLAPYAGPNAAPSLERIAILGPALIAAAPVPHPSAMSFTGNRSSWSAQPLSQSHHAKSVAKERPKASYLVWGFLVAVVTASLIIVAGKILKRGTAAVVSPPPVVETTTSPVPPVEPATAPTAFEPVPTVVLSPTATLPATALPAMPVLLGTALTGGKVAPSASGKTPTHLLPPHSKPRGPTPAPKPGGPGPAPGQPTSEIPQTRE